MFKKCKVKDSGFKIGDKVIIVEDSESSLAAVTEKIIVKSPVGEIGIVITILDDGVIVDIGSKYFLFSANQITHTDCIRRQSFRNYCDSCASFMKLIKELQKENTELWKLTKNLNSILKEPVEEPDLDLAIKWKYRVEKQKSELAVKAKAEENQEIRDTKKLYNIVNFILDLIPLSKEFREKINTVAIGNALFNSNLMNKNND